MTKHAVDVAQSNFNPTWRRRQRDLLARQHFRVLVDFDKRLGIVGDGKPEQQTLRLDWQQRRQMYSMGLLPEEGF
jgi:hypothetical protein